MDPSKSENGPIQSILTNVGCLAPLRLHLHHRDLPPLLPPPPHHGVPLHDPHRPAYRPGGPHHVRLHDHHLVCGALCGRYQTTFTGEYDTLLFLGAKAPVQLDLLND